MCKSQSTLIIKLAIALIFICLIVSSALAVNMGTSGCGGMGGGGCGGGSGTVIDPPIGSLLKDIPEAVNVSPMPDHEMEVNLEAKMAKININGVTANLMTYNGMFPGPTIRIHKGEMLKINLKNSLPFTTAKNLLGFQKNITNLHTHGFHVSPEEPGDFVMYELMPGQTRNHEYDTMYQPGGTLNFYHGHKHGVAAEQYWAGMVGALIVEDDVPALTGIETHTLILKDIALSGSNPTSYTMMKDYMHGKEGNIIMVNGQVNPYLNTKNGRVQRLRILNASNARFYKLSLQNHPMYVIGTDGGLLDKPYSQSYVLLSPGERIDVLIKADRGSGNYKLQALPYARMGMSSSQTITLMTLKYDGSQAAQSIPSVINPDAKRVDPNSVMINQHVTMTLSMGMGRGYINGMDFDVEPFEVMSDLGTYEIWTIINNSGMDHPFHQHVNPAQILSVSGGDSNYAQFYTTTPAWKDTVLIPSMGSVTMLVPVMDWPGHAMFHCHILEHEDIGMMGTWHIMGEPMPNM